MTDCWNCHREAIDIHFCTHCGKIQPAGDRDYFAFLGLPPSLKLDFQELEKRFHDFSRRFHPDRFFRSSEQEQAYSIEQSARLNDSYRTLKELVLRTEYLLSLYGMKPDFKKQQAPAALLEEVFEVKGEIEDLHAASQSGNREQAERALRELRQSESSLHRKMQELDLELDKLSEKWEQVFVRASHGNAMANIGQSNDPEIRVILSALQQNILKRSYLGNLIRQIDSEAGQDVPSRRN
ncbi:MAG TPA: Fe-S protein assembly co-chaperone HscB [Acidobacteriota bacterium]|jgi:molecular chaperone HscB|nr:Fe-S protein assembly co-chaperone HscB [Acidobacteriota bacterium]